MKEVLELANDYVLAVEDRDLAAMQQEKEQAIHSAEGCGCTHCLGNARRSEERFESELWRVYGDGQDKEEEFVASTALTILYQRYPNLGEIED